MSRDEFIEKIKDKFSAKDLKKIYKAYWLAKRIHDGQPRDNGERHFEHCRAVANMLIDHGSKDAEEIIIALLHDSLEDQFVPYGLLEQTFGERAVKALKTLTKYEVIYDESDIVQEKNRKKDDVFFDGILRTDDNAVINIKLADRIHNLQDMRNVWSKERQQEYIIETETYILPLAKKVGGWFLEELEKAMQYDEPFEYYGVCTKCKKKMAALFKLWMKNAFVEAVNKIDDGFFSCPVENIKEIREKLEKQDWNGSWKIVQASFKKSNEFFGGIFWHSDSHYSGGTFCWKGNHFYCDECKRTEWVSDGWSLDVYESCPIHT